MANLGLQQQHDIEVSEKVFANAPNMLMLCLTAIGLIKIYTRFEKVTTSGEPALSTRPTSWITSAGRLKC